jgi:hypothetical protein
VSKESLPSFHKGEEEKRKSPVDFPSFHKEGWPEGPGWFGFNPRRTGAKYLSGTGIRIADEVVLPFQAVAAQGPGGDGDL